MMLNLDLDSSMVFIGWIFTSLGSLIFYGGMLIFFWRIAKALESIGVSLRYFLHSRTPPPKRSKFSE